MKKTFYFLLLLLCSYSINAQVIEESTAIISQLKVQEYVNNQAAKYPAEGRFKGSEEGMAVFEIAFFEGESFQIEEGRASIGQKPGKQLFLMAYEGGKILLEIVWTGEQHNVFCKIKKGDQWTNCSTLKSSLLINQLQKSFQNKTTEGTLDFTGSLPIGDKKIRVLVNFYLERLTK